MTTRPLLEALRASFGGSTQIVYVTSSSNASLVRRMDLVDKVLVLEPRGFAAGATLRLLRDLRQTNLAAFFNLQIHTHRRLAAAIARLSGAPQCFGFYRPHEMSPQDGSGVYANPFAPLDELYREMACRIGASLSTKNNPRKNLAISKAENDEAGALLDGWFSKTDKLLIVNPNASGTAYVRRWPLSYYAEACSAILQEVPTVKIALIGSASEADYVENLRQMLILDGDRVTNLAGLTSFGVLLALLARADCLVSNDTGPLHLGLALDVPVVGLFGPVHPDHNAQLGRQERKIILYQPTLCSPCVHQVSTPPCGGDNRCMRMISPESVVAACCSLIMAGSNARRHFVPEWRFNRHQTQG